MDKYKITIELTVEAEDYKDAEKKVKTALVIDGFEEIRLLNTGIVFDLGKFNTHMPDWTKDAG
jgi:hypothetical protein